MITALNSKAPVTSVVLSPLRRRRNWLCLPILALTCLVGVPGAGAQTENTATGIGTLAKVTTGDFNTADGFQALHRNTTGSHNTASGHEALFSNTNGFYNTADGSAALYHNTSGSSNTAQGSFVLSANTTGGGNTASGFSALAENVIGDGNTANGFQALASNTMGTGNTAIGSNSLVANTTGNSNVASGSNALARNTSGILNSASGFNALLINTTGIRNTTIGSLALSSNTTGDNNIAVGSNAGENLTTGSDNIDIGAPGVAGEAGKIRIGTKATQTATYIAGISGKTVASATGVAVRIDSTGKLGTVLSSARYKDKIKPMEKASEALLKLEPVTFRYKEELDPDGAPQFGLIAEQVEKVDPSLVVRDEDGKVSTVRYEAVNAMLLNEFLKEHRKVEEQHRSFAKQQKAFEAKIAQQQKQIEALTATVQKVSNQIQLTKPAPRVVAND